MDEYLTPLVPHNKAVVWSKAFPVADPKLWNLLSNYVLYSVSSLNLKLACFSWHALNRLISSLPDLLDFDLTSLTGSCFD